MGWVLLVILAFCIVMIVVTSVRRSTAKKAKKVPFINPYVDVSQYDTGSTLPRVNYPNLIMLSSEAILYAAPAHTFVEREQVVGYSGGSSGASVRVAKGLTVRTAATRGKPIRQNVKKFNNGDYIVTNQRIIFIGQNDSFEFKNSKVTAIKMLAPNAFVILAGSRSKNIAVDAGQMKYAVGISQFAIQPKTPAPSHIENNGKVIETNTPNDTQETQKPLDSIEEKLRQLARLKDDGVLSETEFEEKKKELLSRM